MIVDAFRTPKARKCSRQDGHHIGPFDLAFKVLDEHGAPAEPEEVVCIWCVRRQTTEEDTSIPFVPTDPAPALEES